MSDQPREAGDVVDLPDPLPEFLPPAGGEDPARVRNYFDPRRWDDEYTGPPRRGAEDPVAHNVGRLEGRGRAAVFISDFHMADGTAAGDGFLAKHIAPIGPDGLYTGFHPPGGSRAGLFASVVTFVLRRVEQVLGRGTPLDLVLDGDVIDELNLKGRGGTLVSDVHLPFYRTLAAGRDRMEVYWVRGNHDYVVPAGPWHAGEFYVNRWLRVLAEHGDFWDKENWPPGVQNKGSRLVVEAGAAFAVHAALLGDGVLQYLMAGIDNLRPWSNDAVEGFLDRRGKYSDVALLTGALARLDYVGSADDSAGLRGALERRQGLYKDYLMVQGHTHVPAAVPGVYYNMGTWISTLVAPGGEEKEVEAFPFLLVYNDPAGNRVEEYYVAQEKPVARARARLQTPESVNALRKEFGYEEIKP